MIVFTSVMLNCSLFEGLWVVCLNGYHDMRHQYEVKFYGCKHILLEEYDIIHDELQPRKSHILDESKHAIIEFLSLSPAFMVATQTFFTLCFIGMLIGLLFILMYLLCINEYYRVSVLKWLGADLFVAGKLDGRNMSLDSACHVMVFFYSGLRHNRPDHLRGQRR